MKMFKSADIARWDSHTIQKYYQHSYELMAIAGEECAREIMEKELGSSFVVICGTGNNGGDGLVIAQQLHQNSNDVKVVIVGDAEAGTEDFRHFLDEIVALDIQIDFVKDGSIQPKWDQDAVIIDAMFGMGLNRILDGWRSDFVEMINELPNRVISVDLPSGMLPDLMEAQPGAVICADLTLAIEVPKRAMMFPENQRFVGAMLIVSIGLDESFEESENCDLVFFQSHEASKLIKPRKKFGYKNQYGHVRVVAGSRGKTGAAILASNAVLRAGAGLVTASIPACAEHAFTSALPEAMYEVDEGFEAMKSAKPSDQFSVTAIGPGLGQAPETALLLRKFLHESKKPLVIDADALNMIATKKLLRDIPTWSVLTPHIGEFDRLFGEHDDQFTRIETLRRESLSHQLIIVLKGAHTAVACPDGSLFYNSSGNPAMATAGSGDVLTGVIAALIAQGHSPKDAAILGVYIHGLAGDFAASLTGAQGILAGDIIAHLPLAITELLP
jgi:hydroxyethylthiazole kinase-like uncharacterized protein yjeF